MLARDGSMFHNMFTLPSDDTSHNETSDQNPLVLQDEVKPLRALLWILYALPGDIASAALDTGYNNIDRLAHCLEMANKYHFVSIETWAYSTLSSVLQTLISKQEEDESEEGIFPIANIQRISHICVKTSSPKSSLFTQVQKVWSRSVLLATTLEQIATVLIALDDFDNTFKIPRGLAYYQILTVWSESWRNSSFLDREQKIRLLAGYHNLSRTRSEAELRKQLSAFEHSSECGVGRPRCIAAWDSLTQLLVLDPELRRSMFPVQPESETFDYMTKLRVVCAAAALLVQEEVEAENMRCEEMHTRCRKRALKHTQRLLHDAEGSLMDRFEV
ncbi:hypothetical protein CVT24_008199 [Panaeolus cyanescens]|uniref:BTB domain-containing protein n=1 Tax=Panaeolus cyanescens TaxID=181874 RepID=A0A409VF08_9AGAR|nr:hypothetical protein CVT24_008199 [Panaeolus cyanescens]